MNASTEKHRQRDDIVRVVQVTSDELPDFLRRVRLRLKMCRRRRHEDAFNRLDSIERGYIDAPGVLRLLHELGLTPDGVEELTELFELFVKSDGLFTDKVRSQEELLALVKRYCGNNKPFMFSDAEIFIEHLHEARVQREAEQQRWLARRLGIKEMRLFLEFRDELQKLHELFEKFDAEDTRFILRDEAWVALSVLGLVPRWHEHRRQVAALLQQMSVKGKVRRAARRSVAVAALRHLEHPDDEWHGMRGSPTHRPVPLRGKEAAERLDFEAFLSLISEVRRWFHWSMKENFQNFWESCLRRRGMGDQVLGVPEVCRALDDLGMAPTNKEAQLRIKKLLDDANEWGFEPLTLDFDEFVELVRKTKEWKEGVDRASDRDYGSKHMNYDGRIVDEFRVVFDVLDLTGTGVIDVAGVRKALRFLDKDASSDELRCLFAMTDIHDEGTINFRDFLHLIHEHDRREFHRRKEEAKMGVVPVEGGLTSHAMGISLRRRSTAGAHILGSFTPSGSPTSRRTDTNSPSA